MGKKLIVVLGIAILLVALGVAPAFADLRTANAVTGYNNGHYNWTTKSDVATYSLNAGIYVRTPQSTSQFEAFAGPHGGYDTTTNKCQDCHSTHFATGSYMLLRADSRTQACDFCHAGGGGSATNIQMDNQYSSTSAIATETMGLGTGHTLGYKGNAPAGIYPAFSDPSGLACFDCHTPHGNSARELGGIGNAYAGAGCFGAPGDIAGKGTVKGDILSASLLDTMMYNFVGQPFTPTVVGNYAGQNISAVPNPTPPAWASMNLFMADVAAYRTQMMGAPYNMTQPFPGMTWQTQAFAQAMGLLAGYGLNPDAASGAVAADGGAFFASYQVYWGIDADKGNIITKFWNFPGVDPYKGFDMAKMFTSPQTTPRVETWLKPLFPKGRFLLLKDPNISLVGGVEVADTNVAPAGTVAGSAGHEGQKKYAINWDKPIGPAATWGPLSMAAQNAKFPLQFPWAPDGVAMENETCADCHDGAAGSSTQAARVWMPNKLDSSTGTYTVAYSHDSAAEGCARQQVLNPGNDQNFGPHCRNCHTGAASCNQCHGDGAKDAGMFRDNWESYWGPNDPVGQFTAWDSTVGTISLEGKTKYVPPAYVHANAVANVNGQCIDGGFSYPHRTLGAEMLKDSIFGIDFNGQPIAFGQTRGQSFSDTSAVAAYFLGGPATSAKADKYFGRTDLTLPQSGNGFDSLVGAKVENLDSVCIDCHGDATKWQGDAAFVDKWYLPSNFDVSADGVPTHVTGWELLLKGLP